MLELIFKIMSTLIIGQKIQLNGIIN